MGKIFSSENRICEMKGSSTAKMTITDFEAVRDQFLFDIKTIVEMEKSHLV